MSWFVAPKCPVCGLLCTVSRGGKFWECVMCRFELEDGTIEESDLDAQSRIALESGANLDFVAHSREDVPYLLDLVRRLRSRLEAAERGAAIG